MAVIVVETGGKDVGAYEGDASGDSVGEVECSRAGDATRRSREAGADGKEKSSPITVASNFGPSDAANAVSRGSSRR